LIFVLTGVRGARGNLYAQRKKTRQNANKLANYGQITGKLKPHLTAGLVNKVGRVRPDPLKQRCKGSHLFSTLQAFQKL
jgi:hypothetical protein